MKQVKRQKPEPSLNGEAMRSEYDFSGGVRGKYAQRYAEGTNIVVIAPDVAAFFPDSHAVNEALRSLLRLDAGQRTEPAGRSG